MLIKYTKLARTAALKILKILVLSLVISHLDYVNSLLYGLPKSSIKLIQHIQNLATKLVSKRDIYSSCKDALKELHYCQLNIGLLLNATLPVLKLSISKLLNT